MKTFIYLTLFILTGYCSGAQITKEDLQAALRAGELDELVIKINGLDIDLKRAAVANVVELINEGVKVPGRGLGQSSETETLNWLLFLPQVANDHILAVTLYPLVSDRNDLLRQTATRALSTGTGPEVGKFLSEIMKSSFKKLRPPPFKPASEDIARERADNEDYFSWSLTGMLRSESDVLKNEGLRYLKRFRELYSKTADGREYIQMVEEGLKRNGAVWSDDSPKKE